MQVIGIIPHILEHTILSINIQMESQLSDGSDLDFENSMFENKTAWDLTSY